uniref:Uncharacterized protein n=1 Tax=Tetranychus urticae TaxID=32264 RepID=T1K533_TETUR
MRFTVPDSQLPPGHLSNAVRNCKAKRRPSY